MGGALRAGYTWADSLTDVEARQAYELRALESLSGGAPQVRMCSGEVDEATALIYDFLCACDGEGGASDGLYDGLSVSGSEEEGALAYDGVEQLRELKQKEVAAA